MHNTNGQTAEYCESCSSEPFSRVFLYAYDSVYVTSLRKAQFTHLLSHFSCEEYRNS